MKRISLIVAVASALLVVVSLGFFWPFGGDAKELTLPGVVEVHEIRLGSKVGGRVADILVREGQEVAAGTELIRFDVPELQAQRKQLEHRLAAAKAEDRKAQSGPRRQEIADAEAAVSGAKAKLERVRVGWRKELLDQAMHEYDVAQADLTLAKNNFDRVDEIRSQFSKNEYELATANLKMAKGRFEAAKSKREMITKGGWDLDVSEADAELLRAKLKLELLQEGTRAEDKEIARSAAAEIEAKIDEIKVNLSESVVKAPSRMIVEVLGVRKGDLVPPATPVVRALHLDDRWVKVFVPATQLGKLRHMQEVQVTCDAYPGKRFAGKIIQIATISEFTPRNVQTPDEREHQVFAVKVQVEDTGVVFKPGMAAIVHIALQPAP